MKMYILDKTIEYKNHKDSIDQIFEEINNTVNNKNLAFSHLIIDGIDIYEDHYDYFLDNINYIEDVKVIVKTIREISQDILLSTIDYIKRAMPEIEILADEFYKEPSKESWYSLTELIEGIKWIIDSFVVIDNEPELKEIVNSYEEWNLYAKDIHELAELMGEFEEILENADFVSTADILSYEIVPLFRKMEEKLEKLILEEVDMGASR